MWTVKGMKGEKLEKYMVSKKKENLFLQFSKLEKLIFQFKKTEKFISPLLTPN